MALHRLAGAVEVETVSGDIDVDSKAPLDVRAKTVSGDLEIRVPLLRRLDLGTTSEVEEAVSSGAHGPILDVQDADGDGVRIILRVRIEISIRAADQRPE